MCHVVASRSVRFPTAAPGRRARAGESEERTAEIVELVWSYVQTSDSICEQQKAGPRGVRVAAAQFLLLSCLQCVLMPNKNKVKVLGVYIEEDEVAYAKPGENVRIKLLGVEEDQLGNGMMLCPATEPCPVVSSFVGRLGIVELLEHRPLITAGYSCVLHAHTAREEVTLMKLLGVSSTRLVKHKHGLVHSSVMQEYGATPANVSCSGFHWYMGLSIVLVLSGEIGLGILLVKGLGAVQDMSLVRDSGVIRESHD